MDLSVLTAVLTTLLLSFQPGAALLYLWGSNATLNALCANANSSNVAKPDQDCDQVNYVMCFKGSAVATERCVAPSLFNANVGYCDFPGNVSPPQGCSQNAADEVRNRPRECGDGSTTTGVWETCREYMTCTNAGAVRQQCQSSHFYINSTERCMAITEPYWRDIPPVEYMACMQLDLL